MAALHLSRPQPATMRMGMAAVEREVHGWMEALHRRVFVTPELDGWTLVFGTWFNLGNPQRAADVQQACLRLSERYGSAHAYTVDLHCDDSAWLIAEGGQTVRLYRYGDPPTDVGARLPVEQTFLLPHEEFEWWDAIDWDTVDDSFEFRQVCGAWDIAAAMSVSPAAFGPHTAMRGHGLLALTPHGAAHGVPPGTLPL